LLTVRRSSERIATLQGVTASLSAALTPGQVTRVILEEALDLLGARAGIVATPSCDGTFEMLGTHGGAGERIDWSRNYRADADLPANDAYKALEPLWFESRQALAEQYPSLPTSFGDHAWAFVPLVVDQRPIGVLTIAFDAPHPFDSDERGFILATAQQAAHALERAQLYAVQESLRTGAEESARRAGRAAEWLQRLQDVTAALSAALTPEQVAEVVFTRGLGSLRPDYGSVDRLGAPARLERLHRVGTGDTAKGAGILDIEAPLPSAEVVRSGQAIWLESPETVLARFPELAELLPTPLGACAALPLLVAGECTGSLVLGFHAVRRFDDEERTFILAVASQLAQALERARLYEQQARLRREAERSAALVESSDLYRMLVEGSHEYAIFMLDPEGRVVTWTPGAERIYGYRAEEMIGQHFARFYLEGDVMRGKLERELSGASAEGRYEDEGIRVRKDGSQFWANVVITALRGPKGDLRGFSKIIRDISQRKQAEEERLRLFRAQEAVRARDEFLSIASHELKTPIAALKLQAQAIQRATRKAGNEPVPSTGPRIEAMLRQAERLTRLIEGLLDITRITSGRFSLRREEVDLAEVVREAAARWSDPLAKAHCELRLSIEGPQIGSWDHARLEQIAEHLLANAVKYGAGKPVDVMVEGDEARARLVVRDQGIGIDTRDLERIFERFERAVSSRHYGGFGLGLWIVRQIVEAHGGQIKVVSQPGQGSTFEILLPRR
jgi:PAS domain S-box-containing protein